MTYRSTFGWIPGMNGLGKNKDQARPARADDISVRIAYVDRTAKEIKPEYKARGSGSWLSHLIIDD